MNCDSFSLKECKKRAVNFGESLKVVLIPSRIDYKDAGLVGNLWWSSSDFRSFQKAAFNEIRLFSVFEGVKMETARKRLYQPSENDSASLNYLQHHCGGCNESKEHDISDDCEKKKRSLSWEECSSWQCVPLAGCFPFEFIERKSRKLGNYVQKNCLTDTHVFAGVVLTLLVFIVVPFFLDTSLSKYWYL